MPEFQSYNRSRKPGGGVPPREGGRIPPASMRNESYKAGSGKYYQTVEMPVIPRAARTRVKASKSPKTSSPNGYGRPRKVRKNYIIYVAIALIVVMTFSVIVSTTVAFKVKEVVIEGECIYSDEEIMATGKIETGINLIRFDAVRAEKDILDSLVYLDEVVVKKAYPYGISITVEPAERVLSVYNDGLYFEVSGKKRIINSGSERPDGLVVTGYSPEKKTLEAPAPPKPAADEPKLRVGGYLEDNASVNDSEQIELIFRLVDLIEKHNIPDIIRIDISDKFDIKLFNGNPSMPFGGERIEVKLGTPTRLDGKLAVASNIINEEIESNEKGVLRISNPRKGTFKPNPG